MFTKALKDYLLIAAAAWVLAVPLIFPLVLNEGSGVQPDRLHYTIGFALLIPAFGLRNRYQAWVAWTGIVLGLILIGLPWIVGYSAHMAWVISDVIAGVITVGMCVVKMMSPHPDETLLAAKP